MNAIQSLLISEHNNHDVFFAISYQSQTFNDLKYYLQKMHGVSLNRVEPEDFDKMPNKNDYDFINLLTNQNSRKQITEKMDLYSVSRFSFIADTTNLSHVDCVGIGSFLYPSVVIYPNSYVGKDTLIHSVTIITHGCKVGSGCFFSGNVILSGSCQIGNFCWFGTQSLISEKIKVPDDTWIAATRTVRSNKEFGKIA